MTHVFYSVAHRVCSPRFVLVSCCGSLSTQLHAAIGKRLPENGAATEMDVNSWMARTTLEMLGQAGLGYSFDNFVEDSTDAYGESLKLFL